MWRQVGSSVVVPDTNVLLNFGIVDGYELLEAACGMVIVIRDVFKEVESEPPSSLLYSFIRQRRFGFYTLRDAEEVSLRESFRPRLDPGESSMLAYISSREDAIAVTDEKAVRKLCDRSLAGRKTGTVGILAACVAQGHMNKKEVSQLHHRMLDEAKARSPHEELIALLNQL